MKLNKKINFIIFSIILFFLFLFQNNSYASEITLENLDIDAKLLDNGNLEVTETWDADVYDTNTMFKSFEIGRNFKDITNVSVCEVLEDETVNYFINSGEYNYHEEKGYFHAAVNEDDTSLFEIAWGVNIDYDEEHTYVISYEVVDCVNIYSDCAEFYWQFWGADSEIPINHITGRVELPSAVTTLDDLRVWAHGPLNGTIEKVDEKNVSYQVDDFPTETYLEVRIVTPMEVFPNSTNVIYEAKLDDILAEEQEYADEANRQREFAENLTKGLYIAMWVIFVAILVIAIKNYGKNASIKEQYQEIKPTNDYKYFRDFPNEKASPAYANFLINDGKTEIIGDEFSAIIMDLALKKFITFDIVSNNKKDITIIINHEKLDEDLLTSDERMVYQFLNEVNEESFTLLEFERYCEKKQTHFRSILTNIGKSIVKSIDDSNIHDEERKEINSKLLRKKCCLYCNNIFIIFLLWNNYCFPSTNAFSFNINFNDGK